MISIILTNASDDKWGQQHCDTKMDVWWGDEWLVKPMPPKKVEGHKKWELTKYRLLIDRLKRKIDNETKEW